MISPSQRSVETVRATLSNGHTYDVVIELDIRETRSQGPSPDDRAVANEHLMTSGIPDGAFWLEYSFSGQRVKKQKQVWRNEFRNE